MDNMSSVWKARVRAARGDLYTVSLQRSRAGGAVGAGAFGQAGARARAAYAASRLPAVEYAKQRWAAPAPDFGGPSRPYNVFHCAVCLFMGHTCPATRQGVGGEHWCAACAAGVTCVPGRGVHHTAGRLSPREDRMAQAAQETATRWVWGRRAKEGSDD